MSHYTVEALPLISFLSERDIKLPRFQRRSAWSKKQNFELVISIFQEYPVGVVILNQEKNVTWLLDGRQRRSAMKSMREDPVEVYQWAKSYIGFSPKADAEEVSRKYWEKIIRYLEKENEDDVKSRETDYAVIDEDEAEVYDEECTFDKNRQEWGLTVLLELILMVHQIKKGMSQWERYFDFRDVCVALPYAEKRGERRIDSKKLRSTLLEYSQQMHDSNIDMGVDSFVAYIEEKGFVEDDKGAILRNRVSSAWNPILKSIETISASEKILADARIGVIRLHNATPLDAQNIFTRINSGGTQLKSEELLSAKPYWNKIVDERNAKVISEVRGMYERLQIPIPNDIVRWDIAATLISRVEDKGLIFDRCVEDVNMIERITLGFKLISARFLGGISKKYVTDLENPTIFKERNLPEILWSESIDDFVYDLKVIFKILHEDNFFKCLNSWGRPLIKMLSVAIALEFVTLLWKDWSEKGKPEVLGSADTHSFQRNARILFDRLVIEYAKGAWKGSSDSRMANDIRNWKDRFQKVSNEEWKSYIESAISGRFNGSKINEDALRAILYYSHAIQLNTPTAGLDITFDVDHIIPQESFKGNSAAPEYFEGSLANLSLLPTKDNITKKSKRLTEITDPWLKQQIVHYAGIPEDSFALFSDLSNWEKIKESRLAYFLQIFSKIRDAHLNN